MTNPVEKEVECHDTPTDNANFITSNPGGGAIPTGWGFSAFYTPDPSSYAELKQ